MKAKIPARERRHREELRSDEGGNASSSALQIIDRALREFAGRRLVSSAEVVDLLLDLRSAIVLDAAARELYDALEVH